MKSLIKALLLLPGLACSQAADDGIRSPMELVAEARAEINEMSPATLREASAKARALIDVREPDEFAAGHIEGAVNMPRGTLEFAINRHPLLAEIAETSPVELPDTEIVLYCGSGARSALAAQSLKAMGFKNVYSLSGGFRAWGQTSQGQ